MDVARELSQGAFPHPKNRREDYIILFLITLGLLSSSLFSPAYPADYPPVDIHRLIRNMAYNELTARAHPARYYRYVQQEETPQGSQTTLQIGTRQGTVGRLLQVNGKPPSLKQCRKGLGQLQRIAASTRLQQARLRSQQADMSRRESLFAAMPNAFLYHFEGIEKDTGWVRLQYDPNPKFRPTFHAAGVLQGLTGTLWVDPSSQRLVRINGTLVNTVTFGWGILAKLYPGGHFEMRQSRISDGTWQLTSLAVSFQGKLLLFRKLCVNIKDTFNSFEHVSNSLDVNEAAVLLERVHVHCEGQ